MIILGIDPGYAIVGYGVIDADRGRFRTLEQGAVLTQAVSYTHLTLPTIYSV